MKKQLLFGTALLSAVTAYSQSNGSKPKPSGVINMSQKLASKFITEPTEPVAAANKQITVANNPVVAPQEASSSVAAPTTIGWKLISGMANVYGVLVGQTRPLQYNDNVNAVSFIHRKSTSYPASPSNNSGSIVADISTNWGTTWDSTCIWSDATNLGRYPQGSIRTTPLNTSIANAYVVGSGPTTNGSTWTGNFYASKQLNAFNPLASATPSAQQFLSMTQATYAANQGQHGWSRMGFTSTDDGNVRSLALIENDLQGLSTLRGGSVVKGTFNAGVFTWTTDSLIPNCVTKTTGEKQIYSAPQMVWNEAGTVGYVVFIGALQTATLSNRGWQPIVYKTTNSGASWALIPGIDFNCTSMNPIKNPIVTVTTNTALEIPFFNVSEGFDCVVDANNKLHIASTIVGTFSSHQDSLAFTASFTTTGNPSENYQWLHTPGSRPYLYDFVGDGTSLWTCRTIDSLSTEGPSSDPAGSGFNSNPWDPTGTGGAKIQIDARIQLGRTPDGQYITYAWAESDTNQTTNGFKWNEFPNIKTRCFNVSANTLSGTEINVSKPSVGQGTLNASVANRATFHYISQTTSSATAVGTGSVDIKTPLTVTTSQPYSQLTNNGTYYSFNTLTYSNFTAGSVITNNCITGVKENKTSEANAVIYPNPTKDVATLSIDVKENGVVTVQIYNLVGALVKTTTANATVGFNSINLDLSNLTAGIYITNVKVANTITTKKLIIE